MVGLKNGHIRKNLTQKVVNPRDIAGERKKKKKRRKKKDKHYQEGGAYQFSVWKSRKKKGRWRLI